MSIKKEIIYPIFLECCEFTPDIFWNNIFEDLAYGKCVYGTYISKDFLCCSYKDKSFSYKIKQKEPEIVYTEIYNLLTKKLGLLSKKERIKKRLEFYNIEEKIKESRSSWSGIRKKNLKDLLIEQYVIHIKNKYDLSIIQSKYLLSIFYTAIVFKVITNKDIHYDGTKITNIDGVEFNKNEILIKRKIYDLKVNFSPEIIVDKNIMSDNWKKYITLLKKK